MSSCCGLVALNVNHNSSELWANSSTHMQSAEVMHEQGPSTGDAAASSADTQNGREEETLASNNEAVATASPDSAHAAAMQCDPEPGLQLKRKIAWLEKELKDARHAQRTLLGDKVRRLEDENKKLKDDINLLKDDLHNEYMTNHTDYYKQMWEKAENELKKKETEAKQDHEFAFMLENKLDKLNALYHSHLRRDNPFVEYKSWTEMFN